MGSFTVARDSVSEFTERKSLFIGHSFFVRDEGEALSAVEKVRLLHPQASHNVYAYSLRKSGVQRFSDDGEPQGTAGMPVLKVINFSGLTDICIVVTRYFGGILLGAGGLVRAYTRAAAEAAEKGGRAEIIKAVSFSVSSGYEFSNSVSRLLGDFGADVSDTSYTDRVEVFAALEEERFKAFRAACADKLYSNVQIKEMESLYVRRPV